MNWDRAIIDEFHAKDGKGIGGFGDRPMLLTTTGARSGEERTSPVMYHRDRERYIVVASKGELQTTLVATTISRRIRWPGLRSGPSLEPRPSR